MTAKRKLIPLHEVVSLIDTYRKYNLPIHSIDVRTDGVTIHGVPPAPLTAIAAPEPMSAYDQWKLSEGNPV